VLQVLDDVRDCHHKSREGCNDFRNVYLHLNCDLYLHGGIPIGCSRNRPARLRLIRGRAFSQVYRTLTLGGTTPTFGRNDRAIVFIVARHVQAIPPCVGFAFRRLAIGDSELRQLEFLNYLTLIRHPK
jgi:hypothetical protein